MCSLRDEIADTFTDAVAFNFSLTDPHSNCNFDAFSDPVVLSVAKFDTGPHADSDTNCQRNSERLTDPDGLAESFADLKPNGFP